MYGCGVAYTGLMLADIAVGSGVVTVLIVIALVLAIIYFLKHI